MRELRSDRRYLLPATPAAVWAELAALDRYQRRWPWLRRFEATALAPGARWSGVVRGPLPYEVSFTLELTQVVVGESVEGVAGGDVHGQARIELRASDGGTTELRLLSALAPVRGLLVALTGVARPVAQWAHDRVLDQGAEGLAATFSAPS